MKQLYRYVFLSLLFTGIACMDYNLTQARPETQGWGNIHGIRIDGHLMEFESSLRVVPENGENETRTAKEQQRPNYLHKGDHEVITTNIDSIYFHEVIRDLGNGQVSVDVEVTAHDDTTLTGVYFSVELPAGDYPFGSFRFIDPENRDLERSVIFRELEDEVRGKATGIHFSTNRRSLKVTASSPTEVIVKPSDRDEYAVVLYMAITEGAMNQGDTAELSFLLDAGGYVDRKPVHVSVDTGEKGNRFDGYGGNFRLQNPDTDPPVIEYNLENLDLAWSRIEFPWRFWHPDEDVDPIEAAEAGELHPRVEAAMEMAAQLYHEEGLPVMIAVWSGPDWAIEGPYRTGYDDQGRRGNPLDQDKAEKIYESITKFVLYMRDNYGVEAQSFSFNESDLGIYIRQTGEEHAKLIRELGATFEAHGLSTKLLLGDTADAYGYDFTTPAAEDPETHPYISFVSFHSWRGWEDETFQTWHDIGNSINRPLIIGEGSLDAAAWQYPDIFDQPVYALHEIKIYTRIMDIVQPATILQWQLTADYSLLAGGGVFGNHDEPLRPMQRFWNMKQLAATPSDLYVMPSTSSSDNVYVAALGDNDRGEYAVHIVNYGAERYIRVTGLPDEISRLSYYVTNAGMDMEQQKDVRVVNGNALIKAGKTSFISLYHTQ